MNNTEPAINKLNSVLGKNKKQVSVYTVTYISSRVILLNGIRKPLSSNIVIFEKRSLYVVGLKGRH
jgi:hypothetical protein